MDPTTFCNTVAEVLEPRHQAVGALRELADLLEANPLWATRWDAPTFYFFDHDDLDSSAKPGGDEAKAHAVAFLAESARVLAKGQPIGSVRKTADDKYYNVERNLAAYPVDHYGVILAAAARTLVCEMVETGEVETYEVEEIPDEVRERYRVTKTKPVMEQVCSELVVPGYERDAS